MSLEDLKKARIITALVTPFHEDGSINFQALPKLIEYLLAHHTEGLILAGTTGESPTLTHEEELELFAEVQRIVAGRVPLIAGIGTNDTRDSVAFAREVAAFGGFVAGLAVTPYYNKPSQEGLYQHYKAIADASSLPIMVYNVPGRTVAGLTVETSLRLAQHPNIIAIKDCTGLATISHLVENAPEDFLVYTGEDGEAFHAKALGAQGVISVAAHTNGDDFYAMFAALDKGHVAEAAAIHRALLPKVDALFSTTSPAPLKAILNHQGFEVGSLRLPLVACTEEEAQAIITVMEK
ncbi:4-hydroxy-tetrahydrodipicolinate synthase [Streptococcus acidominimus]|uniref:4-hydroxy-tetrahydrodipicolinate synthase n=1 Tax=Streptococcus acidominimus TaxID=1326 RepID=A0A1Q8EBE5_STRAI|nr:4-hydroxy-tetrahydrodipicolinate synthase [Streptococcus acidominimus]OLF49113.1 4-hydroxy-tetrahydrodipicolinate synthase [Streptococcus acidominimus]SUN07665.1 dihydrodipicolinate synthase [Streptococcus acidominimus]